MYYGRWYNLAVRAAMIFIAFFIFSTNAFATTAGIIDSTYKYGWSNRLGWINFKASGGNVQVSDAALTGYIWSQNYGWINLAPAKGGVLNNGEGTLRGQAWGENIGYIDFSGVIIMGDGIFRGYATGTVSGTVSLNCLQVDRDTCSSSNFKVATTWRPRAVRVKCDNGLDDDNDGYIDYPADRGCTDAGDNDEVNPGSGPERGYSSPPQSPGSSSANPEGNFNILIDNNALYTSDRHVILKFFGGPDTVRMSVSNLFDVRDASQIPYEEEMAWDLCSLMNGSVVFSECPEGLYKVYARFYTRFGQASEIVSDSIILDYTPPQQEIEPTPTPAPTPQEVRETENIDRRVITDMPGRSYITPRGVSTPSLPPSPPDAPRPSVFDFIPDIFERVIKYLLPRPKQIPPVEIPLQEVISKETPLSLSKGIQLLKPAPVQAETIYVFREKASLLAQAPLTTPQLTAFSGTWELVARAPLERFVFAPLPKDIELLAEKFPSIRTLFSEVGIKRVTDVERLRAARLTLPTLAETAGIKTSGILDGKVLRPLALEDYTQDEKEKIPTEVIFARTAGGLIDLKIALRISEQGRAQNFIRILSEKELNLLVKISSPARKVKGYIVFRTRDGLEKRKFPHPFSWKEKLREFFAISPVFAQEKITREEWLVLSEFEFTDPDKDNLYTAKALTPTVEGEYDIITLIEYEDPSYGVKEVRLTTLIDPEGYVYERFDDKEARIAGAIITLYWLNPFTKEYEMWPANEFNQENPQITDTTGRYAFLVPQGFYYLEAETPSYQMYKGRPFEAREGSGVHINIEMKSQYWYLKIIDWKVAFMVMMGLFLAYNFYKDKRREKIERKKKLTNTADV